MKPAWTLIPDIEKILSGEKKIVQIPSTRKFTPRSDIQPEGMYYLMVDIGKIIL
jgi:hypothetical protein